ncbi:hypothetical protein [Rhodococcus sp. OK302]|uniref:hypothetical protein n=1 Tax=Rhodococcus sp. OK302 TaxID=1882769 RepID=UPI0015957ECF|nr:hypothetical protein [Rhodococcus sp. OK302]
MLRQAGCVVVSGFTITATNSIGEPVLPATLEIADAPISSGSPGSRENFGSFDY